MRKKTLFLVSKDIILRRWEGSSQIDRIHSCVCACGGRTDRNRGVARVAGRAVADLAMAGCLRA